MEFRAKGKVLAKIVLELKFKTSGKLKNLLIKVGDRVKNGQVLARLDNTPFQNDLDSALLGYKQQRAKFDKLCLEIPTPKNDEEKFEKEQAQAQLDSAIKIVEKAKYELDQIELKSPIDGIVSEINNLYSGLNITPGTQTITIIDPSSLVFSAEVQETDIKNIQQGKFAKVILDSDKNNTLGGPILNIGFTPIDTNPVTYSVGIELPKVPDLRPGLSGTAIFDLQGVRPEIPQA